MWPDLDAYRHSGHWSIERRFSRLRSMTAAELAHEHFTRRLAVETDADDVAAALRDGTADFVLIDARSERAYAAAHLPGAISLPHRTITRETLDALPDGPIVAY
jgi:3-mercaptopyruvate sulfurtransferase SseA